MELTWHSHVLFPELNSDRFAEELMDMPALLWVTFWSSMMGAAACWGDVSRPAPVQPPKHRDLPTSRPASENRPPQRESERPRLTMASVAAGRQPADA